MKEYFRIERMGAISPEDVYHQLEEQSDFLAPDCCGGGVSLEDVRRMMAENWITLEGDEIIVWVHT